MKFFDETFLLHSPTAVALYNEIKDLPIVDYHSHLSEREIAEDKKFSTITEFWLAHDHYKWRAMRMCGISEELITGGAPDEEKFRAYASVMPKLIGNPLYYWTHLELRRIFGITEPLNLQTAPEIYRTANEKLKTLSVRTLLRAFRVEYVATTDDPVSALTYHGVYDGIRVCPTFRPDRALKLDEACLSELGACCGGRPIQTLKDFRDALEERLTYFLKKGCTIADVSMEAAPEYVSEQEAEKIFLRHADCTQGEKQRFFSYGVAFLASLCKKYGLALQLHIGALRNVNAPAFAALGADAGYDVMHGYIDTDAVAAFLGTLHAANNLPKTVLYALNRNAVPALITIAGSFENVCVGAAWWFNDTLTGVRSHLWDLAEYAPLGTSIGMLTDSRSFSSYCRFEFFRRILADFVAERVEAGEYDASCAADLLKDICYHNPVSFMGI